MSLKDVIGSDIHDVFLQSADFAEEIDFDGTLIVGVIDTDDQRGALIRESEALGSFLWDYRIITDAKYFERRPTKGDAVRINSGEIAFVVQVEFEMGMLNIYIVENSS